MQHAFFYKDSYGPDMLTPLNSVGLDYVTSVDKIIGAYMNQNKSLTICLARRGTAYPYVMTFKPAIREFFKAMTAMSEDDLIGKSVTAWFSRRQPFHVEALCPAMPKKPQISLSTATAFQRPEGLAQYSPT